MAPTNPFQTVLDGLLNDLFNKKGVNSPFSEKIRRMQSDIQQRIEGGQQQPEVTPSPGISDPRFRPDLPADPLGGTIQTKKAAPADTRLAQAGPETMTDAPKEKPLQAPPDLINAVITQESGGDPNAVSPKGAIGLMQIMPATATDPGFGIAPIPVEKLTNAAANKKFGTEYLSAMLNRYNGDTRKALIAFNAGHTVADRFNGDLSSLPAETQNYVARIEATLGKRTAEAQSAPGTPAGAPSAVPGGQTPVTPLVAPQAPSAGRAVTPPRPQRPAPVKAPDLPPPPDFNLEVPTLAQGGTRRPIVPVLWQQAVAKFQASRDPKDLASVPKSGLPAILALMGQVARRSRT